MLLKSYSRGEKQVLLEKKAAAEAEAKAAAAAEAAYKAKQASQEQTVVASGNTTFTAEVQAVSESYSSYTPALVKHHQHISTKCVKLSNW